MTDINTNSTDTTKRTQEQRLEKREKKYAAEMEATRIKTLKKVEKKRAKLAVKLARKKNPKIKSSIQDKIDKLDKKIENLKDPAKAVVKRPFGLVMRTWTKGLSKERGRITWHNRNGVVKDIITVVLVCIFLGVIFFAIDMILIALQSI